MDCVFDTCSMRVKTDEFMCSAAAQAMEKCYKNGVKDEWRSKDFCRERKEKIIYFTF